jgi:ribosomal protein S27E
MIYFTCPACRLELEVYDYRANQASTCPNCGANLLIPLASESSRKPARQRSPLEIATAVVGVCSALAGLLTVVWCCGCLGIFTRKSEPVSPFSDYSYGSESDDRLEKARQRGAKAGREEGRRAGEADGYDAAMKTRKEEAYGETISELYRAGDYRRIPSLTFTVVFGFFALGFALQWIALYVPRRIAYLRDIDWIILPREMTQVDLHELTALTPLERDRPPPPPSGLMKLLLLLALLPIIGWESLEQEAWKKGYDANRTAAYQEGWREGATRGEREGAERGKAEAQHGAMAGRAWQLYTTPAWLGLMFGAVVGLAAQYTTLACCRDAGRVPELVTVGLIPAMKHSVAYTVLVRRRELLLWWNEEMRRLAAAKELQVAQVQAVHDVIVRKLRAMRALEELTQARLLDLARQELSRIVAVAEHKAATTAKRAVTCPYCGRTIGYPRKKAGTTVNCPYANCGRPINLPSNVDGE